MKQDWPGREARETVTISRSPLLRRWHYSGGNDIYLLTMATIVLEDHLFESTMEAKGYC